MSKGHIFGTMNGLRGFAALVIVLFHSSLKDRLNLQNGFLAVDLFFVLSGFVIAHSYGDRLENGLSLREFFLVRLVRLYPLYLIGTCISILVVAMAFLIKGRVDETNTVLNAIPWALLMLPAPPQRIDWNVPLYPLNGQAWSLFFELLINLMYALTFRYWSILRLFFFLTSVGSVLILRSVFDDVPFSGGWAWSNIEIGFLRVLYSFPVGVLIYRLYKKNILCPSIPSLVILALFLVLLMLPSTLGVPFSVLVGFPFLVALAARTEPKSFFSPVFITLGTASYAIYAIYQPLQRFVAAVFVKLGLPLGIWPDVFLIISIIPISLLIDSLYDTPLRKYLVRKLLLRQRVHGSEIKIRSAPASDVMD